MSGKSGSGTTPNRGWFSKGRSGNPGGRPTASPTPQPSAFDIVAEKTLTVAHHGIAREIPVEEALQQRTYQDALAGKSMAQRDVLKWIAKREAWLVKHGPKASRPAINASYLARSRQRGCRSHAARDRGAQSGARGIWQ